MKVVVTGSHGFLGTHLVAVLLTQKDVTVNTISRDGTNAPAVLPDTDCIIHIAGVNRDTKKNIEKGNVGFTQKLLGWSHAYSPHAKIIFASSSHVYLSDSWYGKTKRTAEGLIERYSKIQKTPSIILRFSNIYGPFCRPFYNSMIATFIHLIMKREEIVVNGTGDQQRDFLYVSDAVDAIVKAMFYNPRKVSETYDICSGVMVSVKQVVGTLTKCSPVSLRYRLSPVKTREHSGVVRTFARAKNAFGWKPRIGLREGLTDILKKEYGSTHKKTQEKN